MHDKTVAEDESVNYLHPNGFFKLCIGLYTLANLIQYAVQTVTSVRSLQRKSRQSSRL